jgi:opacity protein-like surface antigen
MTTKKTFAQLLALPIMLASVSAMAATQFDQPGDGPFFGETANGQWLVGVKYVDMNNSDDGIGEEEARNAGIILGYEFARPVWKGKAAFEFQYLPSIEWGDVNDADSSNPSEYPAGGRWENPVYSGYVAYRTPGKLYAKGKVGIVASRFKIETTQTEQQYEDIIGLVPELTDPTVEFPEGEETGKLVEGVVGQTPVGPAPEDGITIQENKTQIGYGLGLGVHLGKHFDLELEYEGNQGKSQLYNFGINAIGKF